MANLEKYAFLEGSTVTKVLLYESEAAPNGGILVTDETGEASIGCTWDGHTFAHMEVPQAHVEIRDIDAERDRRIYSSVHYVGPSLTATLQTDQSSMESISGAATLAGFALVAGAQPGDYFWHGGTTPFSWIALDNSVIQIDAQTMFHIGQVVAGWKTKHIFAARALKEMTPIPTDFDNDEYWPK